jgi:hypothetical protein
VPGIFDFMGGGGGGGIVLAVFIVVIELDMFTTDIKMIVRSILSRN